MNSSWGQPAQWGTTATMAPGMMTGTSPTGAGTYATTATSTGTTSTGTTSPPPGMATPGVVGMRDLSSSGATYVASQMPAAPPPIPEHWSNVEFAPAVPAQLPPDAVERQRQMEALLAQQAAQGGWQRFLVPGLLGLLVIGGGVWAWRRWGGKAKGMGRKLVNGVKGLPW